MYGTLKINTPNQGDFAEATELLRSTLEDVAGYVMHQRNLEHVNLALQKTIENFTKESAQFKIEIGTLRARLLKKDDEIKQYKDAVFIARTTAGKYKRQLETESIEELMSRIAKIKYAIETSKPISQIKF